MNRLIRLTDPDDGVTEYEFDAGSRLVEMVYPTKQGHTPNTKL